MTTMTERIRETSHPTQLLTAIGATESTIYREYASRPELWTPEMLERLRKAALDIDALFGDLNAASAAIEEAKAAAWRVEMAKQAAAFEPVATVYTCEF